MSPAVVALGLAGARLWALLLVQGSWRRAIGGSWVWIAAALALVLAGVAGLRGQLGVRVQWSASELSELIVALVLELLLGGVLGLLASLPGWALIGAADESAEGLGLREQPRSLATMLIAASLAAALALGLHRPLLASLLGSFDRFALGRAATWAGTWALGPALLEQAIALSVLGLALATPVLLTRVLVTLCIASLARTGFEAQQLIAVIGPGLRLGAGLLALGAAWSAYPQAFARALA